MSDRNQWLQIDLGNKTQITGISTQGHRFHHFWVKSYSLRYSNNGVVFEVYASGQQSKVNSFCLGISVLVSCRILESDSNNTWRGKIC